MPLVYYRSLTFFSLAQNQVFGILQLSNLFFPLGCLGGWFRMTWLQNHVYRIPQLAHQFIFDTSAVLQGCFRITWRCIPHVDTCGDGTHAT
jgi:hypothetical protein